MNHVFSRLKGTGVAIVTPFKSDLTVDYNSIKILVDHVIDGGVSYIVVQGTTGESSTLSEEEKIKTRSNFLSANNGRVPMVLGFGGNDTDYLVKKLRESDFDGFSALLSVVPYYNKPSQNGLFKHFSQIVNFSKLPIILYNVPGRTGCNLEPETTIKLANSFKNIIGIKEANPDVNQIKKLITNRPKNFLIISGDDETAPNSIINGADGVISVAANAIPKKFVEIINLSLLKDKTKVFEMLNEINPFLKLLFEEGNPSGVKSALNDLGLCQNNLRLPLLPVSLKLQRKIKNFISKI